MEAPASQISDAVNALFSEDLERFAMLTAGKATSEEFTLIKKRVKDAKDRAMATLSANLIPLTPSISVTLSPLSTIDSENSSNQSSTYNNISIENDPFQEDHERTRGDSFSVFPTEITRNGNIPENNLLINQNINPNSLLRAISELFEDSSGISGFGDNSANPSDPSLGNKDLISNNISSNNAKLNLKLIDSHGIISDLMPTSISPHINATNFSSSKSVSEPNSVTPPSHNIPQINTLFNSEIYNLEFNKEIEVRGAPRSETSNVFILPESLSCGKTTLHCL